MKVNPKHFKHEIETVTVDVDGKQIKEKQHVLTFDTDAILASLPREQAEHLETNSDAWDKFLKRCARSARLELARQGVKPTSPTMQGGKIISPVRMRAVGSHRWCRIRRDAANLGVDVEPCFRAGDKKAAMAAIAKAREGQE